MISTKNRTITFLHYFFRNDGVTNVVLNNLRGLQQLQKGYDFQLAASYFATNLPEDITKKKIVLDDPKRSIDLMVQDLESLSQTSSMFIIENPTVGLYPNSMYAFKRFTEKNPDFPVLFRIHDTDYDRAADPGDYSLISENGDRYARTGNAKYITPISSTSRKLKRRDFIDSSVLENPIRTYLFEMNDKRKELSYDLRKKLHENGFVGSDQKILTYPVRVFPTKNIEEALLDTKLLNMDGLDYKLIVTLFNHEKYSKLMKDLSEDYGIPSSIGEVHDFITFDDGFTIANLYDISDAAITTSIYEGFGYAFVEPWLSRTPLVGRDLPETTSDFKNNGLDMGSLYSNTEFEARSTSYDRTKHIKDILSDKARLHDLKRRLDLTGRLEYANGCIEQNFHAGKKYDYVSIAQKLNSIIEEYGV
ncbi:MAG: glycosyltransferase [Nanoarchaeota archaeon]